MIPLKDVNPSRTRPVVTTFLVLVNILVFLHELTGGGHLDHFFREFGVVPSDIRDSFTEGRLSGLWPVLTSMFLHGGWLHLIGNMLFLWVFGDNVEDRIGHWRFLFFYMAGGLVAGVTHIALNLNSGVPTIGASGAVAAVLGAYSFLFPGARVVTLVPLGFFLQTVELPSRLFFGIWFVIQFVSATALAVSKAQNAGGVAWWAHVGGFVFGLAVVAIFYRDRRRRPAPTGILATDRG